MNRCVDCGLAVQRGERCRMHETAHRRKARWISSDMALGVKCTAPGRLEEIFIEDLASGQSVREIANHRGFETALVRRVLSNASDWFKTRERDLGKYFAAVAIDRAVSNIDHHLIEVDARY